MLKVSTYEQVCSVNTLHQAGMIVLDPGYIILNAVMSLLLPVVSSPHLLPLDEFICYFAGFPSCLCALCHCPERLLQPSSGEGAKWVQLRSLDTVVGSSMS